MVNCFYDHGGPGYQTSTGAQKNVSFWNKFWRKTTYSTIVAIDVFLQQKTLCSGSSDVCCGFVCRLSQSSIPGFQLQDSQHHTIIWQVDILITVLDHSLIHHRQKNLLSDAWMNVLCPRMNLDYAVIIGAMQLAKIIKYCSWALLEPTNLVPRIKTHVMILQASLSTLVGPNNKNFSWGLLKQICFMVHACWWK